MAVELFAYGDESGLHENPRYCFMCGFIASPRQWKMFNKSWKNVLDQYDISDFHSTEFFPRDENRKRIKQYSGWTDEKANKYFESLLRIIQARRIYPIGGAVDVNDFNSNPEGVRRYLTGGAIGKNGKWKKNTGSTKPYHLAFIMFISDAVLKAKDDTVIHFILDTQDQFARQALNIYDEFIQTRHPDWRQLRNLIYSDRLRSPGLQVADLYTYSMQSLASKGNLDTLNPLVKKALGVFRKKRKSITIWTNELTEKALDDDFTEKQTDRLQS